MKVAVIGRGKTGSAVIECLGKDAIHDVYHSQNPVTIDGLKGADVAIVFVPGAHFKSAFRVLETADIPVVSGVSGFTWPEGWQARLTKPWIRSLNFSLAMYFIRHCLGTLGKITRVLPEAQFALSETHHVKKLDAPSGTALYWRDWLGHDGEIVAKREGDVKGFHELMVELPFETITLNHKAKDRQLFAQGAIWAARYLCEHNLPPKAYDFYQILDDAIGASLCQ